MNIPKPTVEAEMNELVDQLFAVKAQIKTLINLRGTLLEPDKELLNQINKYLDEPEVDQYI